MNAAVVSNLPPCIAEPRKGGTPLSLLPPSERDFGSLRASLSGLREVILTY